LIVRENGLTAALGFLSAKGGTDIHSPENLLLSHYAVVLGAHDSDELRQTTIAANLVEYRRLTSQTLSAAEWFKRYAEAVLKVDATGVRESSEENENA
jgi:CRISPR-associated protein Cmr5